MVSCSAPPSLKFCWRNFASRLACSVLRSWFVYKNLWPWKPFFRIKWSHSKNGCPFIRYLKKLKKIGVLSLGTKKNCWFGKNYGLKNLSFRIKSGRIEKVVRALFIRKSCGFSESLGEVWSIVDSRAIDWHHVDFSKVPRYRRFHRILSIWLWTLGYVYL
jgi:hypothetical protein